MNLFKRIKSDLDKKIEDDKMSANEKSTETFSVKSILDGRILLHSGFRRMIPLIVCLFILSIAYIKNRFSYEALVVKNNELKEIKTDLQTTGLVKMQQYKELSNRSAVIKKLAEMGSSVSEARTPPIVIEK
ncbi:conserved hypothetical protein [Bacteroidetes oral taxon 274 str. F0058]|nr:conserved hypothetical protein [Bacteroidetes oral taxon 274 str. F0058]